MRLVYSKKEKDAHERQVKVHVSLCTEDGGLYEFLPKNRGIIPSLINLSVIIQKFRLRLSEKSSKYPDIPHLFQFASLKIFGFYSEELMRNGMGIPKKRFLYADKKKQVNYSYRSASIGLFLAAVRAG